MLSSAMKSDWLPETLLQRSVRDVSDKPLNVMWDSAFTEVPAATVW
jgi:hypothetical protein